MVIATGLLLCGHAVFAEDGALSDVNYRLGDGLHIPGLGLTFGGYATASYDRLKGLPGRAALDDLSLSVWWESAGPWKVFSEFDYENAVSSRSVRDDDEHQYLALERIYVDYAVNELTTVRAGRFLTPIGRWNLIHATPLVWTTSRPLVTTLAFPTNVTGLMVSGAFQVADETIEYSVYGSSGNKVRPKRDPDTFQDALGLHALAPLPIGGELGFSYVSFRQSNSNSTRKDLFGLDYAWTRDRFEISAEGVYRIVHNPEGRNEGGGFIQIVAPLTERLYAIGRYEIYRQALHANATCLWVTGLSYRLTPAIVLKAEWVGSHHNELRAPEGLLSSISVLF